MMIARFEIRCLSDFGLVALFGSKSSKNWIIQWKTILLQTQALYTYFFDFRTR